MGHSEPLHHSFAHFVQTISISQQDSLVFMIPKLYQNLFLLQKLHLFLVTTPYDFPIPKFQEKEFSNIHHLQYLKIEPIDLHKLPLFINRQHVLESKRDHLGILRVSPKGKLDSLDLGDMVQPNATTCQHVGLEVISDAEVVVLVTQEDC